MPFCTLQVWRQLGMDLGQGPRPQDIACIVGVSASAALTSSTDPVIAVGW
jgi:hypothetical protein